MIAAIPLQLLSLALLGAASAALAPLCSEALPVRLSTPDPTQGSIVLLEVSAAAPGGTKATWAGREVQFWRDDPRGLERALLGVDLESVVGAAPLVLRPAGESPCRVGLEVRKGDYGVERLRLPRRLVDLGPRDAARARREARRLRAIYRGLTPERLWDGGFRLPLDGVEPSGNFGRKRILNGEPRSPHSGVDFSAPSGTPVQAPQRGRVVLASTLFFSGRTVVLDHGLGLFSFYGHLSGFDVREGDVVPTGAPLGKVGATGRATGPHLHWGARLNGARVNPLDLVGLPVEKPSS